MDKQHEKTLSEIPLKPAGTEKKKLNKHRKKRLKNVKLATKENPTVVVPESVDRPFLREALKDSFLSRNLELDKGKEIDFTKRTSRGFDYFQLNVLFNKFLTVADVKLAIYLHNVFVMDDEINLRGLVFVVRRIASNMELSRAYGELGGVYIRDNYHSKEAAFYKEEEDFWHLIECSENLVGSDSPTVLAKTLQRLHDSGYITVTDITPETQAIPIPSKTKKSDANRRVRLKHIRLCKWMVYNKVFWELEGM